MSDYIPGPNGDLNQSNFTIGMMSEEEKKQASPKQKHLGITRQSHSVSDEKRTSGGMKDINNFINSKMPETQLSDLRNMDNKKKKRTGDVILETPEISDQDGQTTVDHKEERVSLVKNDTFKEKMQDPNIQQIMKSIMDKLQLSILDYMRNKRNIQKEQEEQRKI